MKEIQESREGRSRGNR